MRVLLLKIKNDKLNGVPVEINRLPNSLDEFNKLYEGVQLSDKAYCYEIKKNPKELAQEFECQLLLYEDFKTEYVSLI